MFEDTTGLRSATRSSSPASCSSVELGPGLLGQIFDGLQNPLPQLAEQCGFFLQRGVYLDALPRDREWEFTPTAKAGDVRARGDTLGTVPEGIFKHRIMVPFRLPGATRSRRSRRPASYERDGPDRRARRTSAGGSR